MSIIISYSSSSSSSSCCCSLVLLVLLIILSVILYSPVPVVTSYSSRRIISSSRNIRIRRGERRDSSSAASASLSTPSSSPSLFAVLPLQQDQLQVQYEQAHEIRGRHGHDIAQPLYEQLLQSNPDDITVATRMAAGRYTLQRQNYACYCRYNNNAVSDPSAAAGVGTAGPGGADSTTSTATTMLMTHQQQQQLHSLLRSYQYNTKTIAQRMGILSSSSSSLSGGDGGVASYACCPIYITPAKAGSVVLRRDQDDESRDQDEDNYINSSSDTKKKNNNTNKKIIHPNQYPSFLNLTSPLDCFIAMFLLGLCITRPILEQAFGISSPSASSYSPLSSLSTMTTTTPKQLQQELNVLNILESFGFIFPCEYDSQYIIPFVSIYPLDLLSPLPSLQESSSSSTISTISSNNSNSSITMKTLYFVTDWHPNVLATTLVGTHPTTPNNKEETTNEYPQQQEEAVMYIGPDSLALIQHWILQQQYRQDYNLSSTPFCLLDLGTGSGIQALVALATLQEYHTINNNNNSTATTPPLTIRNTTTVCVDINPRALRFTAFNAQLNNLIHHVNNNNNNNHHILHLVLGDIVQGTGQILHPQNYWTNQDESLSADSISKNKNNKNISSVELKCSLIHLLMDLCPSYMFNHNNESNMLSSGYDWILSNPPFLPVPDTIDSSQHGLYSSGGPTGETILSAVLYLSSQLLKTLGFLTLVSEFFFRSVTEDDTNNMLLSTRGASYNNGTSTTLLGRLKKYWGDGRFAKALLFTNEFPITAQTYAERRSSSLNQSELDLWQSHLIQNQSIVSCSPGLLYIQKHSIFLRNCWKHSIVPKSIWGSIWTPFNPEATYYTQTSTSDYFFFSNETTTTFEMVSDKL